MVVVVDEMGECSSKKKKFFLHKKCTHSLNELVSGVGCFVVIPNGVISRNMWQHRAGNRKKREKRKFMFRM
jgi:hypothetical protein